MPDDLTTTLLRRLRTDTRDVHDRVLRLAESLAEEELRARPGAHAPSIAFHVWHLARWAEPSYRMQFDFGGNVDGLPNVSRWAVYKAYQANPDAWTPPTEAQIVGILREAEQGLKTIGELCREHGVSEQTYYRWRRKYPGMAEQDLRRLRELQRENSRLQRLVAERDLEIDVLKEFLGKGA